MISNFLLSCLSLIGRDSIYSSVPQSEYTANCDLRCIGVSSLSYAKLATAERNTNAVIVSLAINR